MLPCGSEKIDETTSHAMHLRVYAGRVEGREHRYKAGIELGANEKIEVWRASAVQGSESTAVSMPTSEMEEGGKSSHNTPKLVRTGQGEG